MTQMQAEKRPVLSFEDQGSTDDEDEREADDRLKWNDDWNDPTNIKANGEFLTQQFQRVESSPANSKLSSNVLDNLVDSGSIEHANGKANVGNEFGGNLASSRFCLSAKMPSKGEISSTKTFDPPLSKILPVPQSEPLPPFPSSLYLQPNAAITLATRMPTSGSLVGWKVPQDKRSIKASTLVIDSNSGKRIRFEEDPQRQPDLTPNPLGTSTISPVSETKRKGDKRVRYSLPSQGSGNSQHVGNGDSGDFNIDKQRNGVILTLLSIEIFVLQRVSANGTALVPDSSRDCISGIAWSFCRDQGDGSEVVFLDQGCIIVPTNRELGEGVSSRSKVRKMGGMNNVCINEVLDERGALLRLASVVQWKDPDLLMSWDTLDSGLGYAVERGKVVGVDMLRLMGRMPWRRFGMDEEEEEERHDQLEQQQQQQQGDIGRQVRNEWIDKVGAGQAIGNIAGRIGVCCWRIMSCEVKHPNVSFLPATVQEVLNKRLPHHSPVTLTKWWSENGGSFRWRVLEHMLNNAKASVSLMDAIDVIGRTVESCRLCTRDFEQSLPGGRASEASKKKASKRSE